MQLPKDPAILLSFVNTRLRDSCKNLQDLCRSLEVAQSDLEQRLAAIDYTYDAKCNQFV